MNSHDNDGFFNFIRINFGDDTVKSMKEYCHWNYKIVMLKARKKFLTSCRNQKLFPRFITDLSSNYDCLYENGHFTSPIKVANFIHNIQRQHLNLSIRSTFAQIKCNVSKLFTIRCKILQDNKIPNNISIDFLNEQKAFASRNLITENDRLNIKFQDLKIQAYMKQNKEWFMNLTSVVIPLEVQHILSLGPKFNLPYKSKMLPIKNLVCDIENIVNQIEDHGIKQDLKSQSVVLMSNHKFMNDRFLTNRDLYLLQIHKQARVFLNEHEELVILKSDKGNITIAEYRVNYELKMRALLENDDYKEVKRIPICTLEKKNNSLVNQLHHKELINDYMRCKLTTYTATESKMYGVIKYHKQNCPVRPVTSINNAPQEKLSKWICSRITNINTNNKYNFIDSWDFVQKLEGIQIDDNEEIISTDMVSMFTSIPNEVKMNSLKKRWPLLVSEFQHKMDWRFFEEIIKFCTEDSSYFSCLDKKWMQVRGSAMGNSLSPILADFVLTDIFDYTFEKLKFTPKFVGKYVDDAFLIIPRNMKTLLMDVLNSFHPNIKFTIETEVNGSMPYLDTKVHRKDGILITNWYSKPTSKGRFLNYFSAHNMSMKVNTALGVLRRIFGLSNSCFWNENTIIARELLIKNSYPKKLVEKLITDTIRKITHQRTNNISIQHPNEDTNHFSSITYVPHLSEKLRKCIKPKCPDLNIAFKHNNTIGKTLYSKIKDKNPVQETSNVVYKIPCKDCNKTYIGQTSQKIRKRNYGHKNDQKNYATASGSLAKHIFETGHSFSFDETSILEFESNPSKRLIMEGIHIFLDWEDNVNCRDEINGIDRTYSSLLKNHYNSNTVLIDQDNSS